MLHPNSSPSAPDGASLASPLPASATTALRCWLQAVRRAHAMGAEERPSEVRRVMQGVCDEAHRRGVRVEQLIVLLKEQWATLPPDAAGDGRSSDYHDRRRELLDDLVRVCIEEFYTPARVRDGRPATRASSNAAVLDGSATRT